MLPLETAQTINKLLPPQGKEDEIGTLPYYISKEHGYDEIVSIWQPSPEERLAIANGQNVRLGVGWIGGFPPVALGVTHEGAE